MKRYYFGILTVLLFISACSSAPKTGVAQGQPPNALQTKPAVPTYTTDPHSPTQPADLAPASTEVPAFQPPVLNIGIMIHLEGWDDEKNKDAYQRHIDLVTKYADLFERYGAVMTLETIDVAAADKKWGGTFLADMAARGHAIGLHADVGGNKNYACQKFPADLRRLKRTFDQLGVPITHVSGIVSACDWVTAAAEAGFSAVTGNVAYSLLSLDPALIPPEFADCPNPSACHQPWPSDLASQIHPWRAESGANWIENDPNGAIIILTESGGLAHLAEQLADPNATHTKTEFTRQDIDAYFTLLDQALALADPALQNNFYVSWSIGSALDEGLLEEWLTRLQPYVESGKVRWMGLPDMAEEYANWQVGR